MKPMKFLQFDSIGKKILIPTLTLTILLLGGLGAIMTWKNNRAAQEMMRSKGNAVLNFMSNVSAEHYINFDYLSLEGLVKDIVIDSEVEFAVFYDEEHKALTDSSRVPDGKSSLMIFDHQIIDTEDNVIGYLKLGYKTSKLTANLRSNILVVIGITVIAVLLFLLGMTLIVRSITQPVQKLVRMFDKIAEGEGDLTKRLHIYTTDEIGALARGFNRFLEKLNAIISKVASVTDELTASAEKVSSSALQIADGSKQQTIQTDQVAMAIQEITSSVVNVAESSSQAAVSAREASATASEGGDVVSKTIIGMNRISQSVKNSAENIEALGRNSEQIGEIIKVIDDIAGQTNLLALNAAIEAARAGEQGRGFAVVADEVRKLAEKTTSATQEIGEMIKGIQSDTGKAVKSMHIGTEEVQIGVELANNAGQSLKDILGTITNVSDMVQHIAAAAEQQSATSEEISSTVESVANVSKETAESAEESSNASRQLTELAIELQNLVGGFKLQKGTMPAEHDTHVIGTIDSKLPTQ